MHTTTQAILEYNGGRDPQHLSLKLAAMRSNPFTFFRGTCALFYRTLAPEGSLLSSPAILACGDLHLENFGSYKGDNRLVYFDLNDFDESCAAPVALELVRFLTSILVAAKPLKINGTTALKMVGSFIETYAANVISTKPRWIERSIATGPVKKLLQSLKGRHRCDLIKQRTLRKAGKIRLLIDGEKTLAVSPRDRARAESILSAFASTQASPAFFQPIDFAQRIAGNGSLGLERYVALVRGDGSVDGQYLIDMKLANPSALAANINVSQPRWRSEAERVIAIQRIAQAISPALLGSVGIGKRSYLIKELQPSADRVNLAALGGKSGAFNEVVRAMAETTAWAHLRGCGRYGAGSVDALAGFAKSAQWRSQIIACAQAAKALVLQQWQDYSADYDADPNLLRSAAGSLAG